MSLIILVNLGSNCLNPFYSSLDGLRFVAIKIKTLKKKQTKHTKRCLYIQSFDIAFLGKYLSYRQNIVKFVIYWSELVNKDTLLALYKTHKKNCFGGHFVFFLRRLAITSKRNQQIFLISAKKIGATTIATVITTTCRYSVKKFMKQLEFQNLNIDIRHFNIWNVYLDRY